MYCYVDLSFSLSDIETASIDLLSKMQHVEGPIQISRALIEMTRCRLQTKFIDLVQLRATDTASSV